MSCDRPQAVVLAVTSWTCLALVAVPPSQPTLLAVVVLVGLLVARAIGGTHLATEVNARMDAAIYVGLIVAFGILLQRVFKLIGQ